MAELLKVAKAMFQNKKDWSQISEDDKIECFFVFNRYFSKVYPYESQLLNDKLQDKVLAMDLWFNFMKDKPYPKWFWSKSEKNKDDSDLNEKESLQLLFHLDITKSELDLLLKFYPELIKEELKYLKDVTKPVK